MTTETTHPEPSRARPILSTEDANLLWTAVLKFIDAQPEGAERVKYSNLYHRLGRLG